MINYNIFNRKIFDVHSHIGRFGSWTMKGNLVEPFPDREVSIKEEQEKFMTKFGISKAVVMPHYTPKQETPFDVYNPIVLDTVKGLKNVYGGLWVSPLPENTERTLKVLNNIPSKKIVVLKISPDSWPKGKYTPNPETWDAKFKENMENIISVAKKNDLIIQTHTGNDNSDVLHWPNFVEKYGKDLKLHFCHMGGVAGGHIAFVPRFIEWLRKGYDFYCDTSFCKGFGPAWLVKELEKKLHSGIERVMFASDNPWGVFESEFWRVEGISCSDEVKNKIFYENAERVYCKKK